MSFEFLSRVGLLLLFTTIWLLVWTSGTVIASLVAGIKMQKISLFFGKPVFTIPTRFCPLCIGYIPTGGYVSHDMEEFPNQPLWARWLVVVGGPVAVLGSAILCLGAQETAKQIHAALFQLASGVSGPLVSGKPLVANFFAAAQTAPIAGFGILVTKLMPLYLIPAPAMPLGRLLIEIPAKRQESGLGKVANVIGMLIALPVFICWGIAVGGYFWEIL